MDDDSIVGTAPSRGSALAPLFRGRFCDVVLGGRPARVFEEDEVLYEVAACERTFFFVRTGIVKIGTITAGGREIAASACRRHSTRCAVAASRSTRRAAG